MSWIRSRIAPGTIVNIDEAPGWDALHAHFEMRRIDHSQAYSEAGHHHHIAGVYLLRYAQEASWRGDDRRVSDGDRTHRVAALALAEATSPDFVGYWQRRRAV